MTITVVGAVFAIGQARRRVGSGRVTWRAGTLALAMPLAATLADLNPPWVPWSGFLAVNVLLYLIHPRVKRQLSLVASGRAIWARFLVAQLGCAQLMHASESSICSRATSRHRISARALLVTERTHEFHADTAPYAGWRHEATGQPNGIVLDAVNQRGIRTARTSARLAI